MTELDPEITARYVYHSNRLDGLALSEEQTRRALAGGCAPTDVLTGEDGKEYEAEVALGHARALKGMVLMARSDAPLSHDSIRALHQALMGELLLSAGEYRECTLRYKGLLIASPPDRLQERMEWFVGLVNSGLKKSTDPHKLSWRIHHEFITLHPFIEGNGRMARLLLNMVRLRRGLDLTIVPFENRDKYSRAIIEFQQQKIQRDRDRMASAEGPIPEV
ncbi:MAG: Fic family protein [Planctomycetes bacterium]|nr:Fic family protein [Planctomycetota bacterium]